MNFALEFSLTHMVQEEHRPLQTYALRFCELIPEFWNCFATVGGNCASVYSIESCSGRVTLKQAYLDQDVEEVFYSCCWAADEGSPLLVIAGFRGIIKVINCTDFNQQVTLLGHGNAVNDLRVHPVNEDLIFSASKDESVRLWNIKTAVCIAMFAGDSGHRDEVLCVDVHPMGHCIVSAGMDTSIKIWNLLNPHIMEAVKKSYCEPRRPGNIVFNTYTQQAPIFTTTLVHNDYVDSVRWFGDVLLSKSTKNKVMMWSPDAMRYAGAPLLLKEFLLQESELWFVRLDISVPLDVMAVGDRTGKIRIFSLSDLPSSDEASQSSKAAGIGRGGVPQFSSKAILTHPKCQSTIRQVSVSPDGSVLAACCDDGSLWIWRISCSPVEPST